MWAPPPSLRRRAEGCRKPPPPPIMLLLIPSDPVPSCLQNHPCLLLILQQSVVISLWSAVWSKCGGQQPAPPWGSSLPHIPGQLLSAPGPLAGEPAPSHAAGLCVVSTELCLEDSASQTLTCMPKGPDCITSHSKTQGPCCVSCFRGQGFSAGQSVVQSTLSFIL